MPKLCVIPADGIGQEVIPAAVTILREVIPDLETIEAQAGWECFLKYGVSVPQETLAIVQECGAALFGAVASPTYPVKGYRSAIVTLRQALDLYANIRPVRSLPVVSPRPDVDMVIVRENTQDLYSGRERIEGETAIAERVITRTASQRIARKALEILHKMGRKRLTIIHKANILPLTDGLFRESVKEIVLQYSQSGLQAQVDEMLVDTAALKMIAEPTCFDIIVTTNMFGDILSDAAAYWCGGIGLAPSLNWGDSIGIAEPVHGSAPDIAGKGIANPIAAILSAALLVRHLWKQTDAAETIEAAVRRALPHISRQGQVTTESVTRRVLEALH